MGVEEVEDDDEQKEEEVEEEEESDDEEGCEEPSESFVLEVEPMDSQLCTETRLFEDCWWWL